LVIFAYFAALQPNQHLTNWAWILTPSTLIIIIVTIINPHSLFWLPITPNTAQIYSPNNTLIPILLGLILFLALIMVIKTSQADKGPLRPFSYVQPNTKNAPRH
jgi:hypothetical protein